MWSNQIQLTVVCAFWPLEAPVHASDLVAGRWRGLPDTARPLVTRGLPEGPPELSPSREGAACESEEGRSFAEEEKHTAVSRDVRVSAQYAKIKPWIKQSGLLRDVQKNKPPDQLFGLAAQKKPTHLAPVPVKPTGSASCETFSGEGEEGALWAKQKWRFSQLD